MHVLAASSNSASPAWQSQERVSSRTAAPLRQLSSSLVFSIVWRLFQWMPHNLLLLLLTMTAFCRWKEPRSSATPSSKKESKRLANGRSLFQRWVLLGNVLWSSFFASHIERCTVPGHMLSVDPHWQFTIKIHPSADLL